MKFAPGSAEDTGLESSTYDLVSVASSFHWPDLKPFQSLIAS